MLCLKQSPHTPHGGWSAPASQKDILDDMPSKAHLSQFSAIQPMKIHCPEKNKV
jgi:hypothetical protein